MTPTPTDIITRMLADIRAAERSLEADRLRIIARGDETIARHVARDEIATFARILARHLGADGLVEAALNEYLDPTAER